MGILNGKKLNIKPIGFGEGNYLRKFSIATSLHGVIYLGEPKRPFLERLVSLVYQYIIKALLIKSLKLRIKNYIFKYRHRSNECKSHILDYT